MNPKTRKRSLTILKWSISFVILGLLYYQAKQDDQFNELWASQKHYGWLLFALGAGLATFLISFFRWYILVRALDLKFTYYDAVRLGFLGNLMNLISIGVLGGDAVKSVFLAKQLPGRAPEAVASVIFDRAIGLLAMFSFASVAYLLTDFNSINAPQDEEGKLALDALHLVCRITIVLTLIGFAALGVLFFTPRFHKTKLYKRVVKIKSIGSLFARLVSVVLAYRRHSGAVVTAFGLSLLVNVGFALSLYGVASGLFTDNPSLADHFVITPIAMVANAVPLPGGIGGMEAAVAFLYQAFSENQEASHGFIVALGFRIILLSIAGIGLIFYLCDKKELKALTGSKLSV
ncbi:MAG: lysylphosphatidylglycerol synthase transmembrane domain-containing protein [Pirellulaceae bacterium]|nr:lysylphosphatidylglycerol synthase transmembrane domain-containing protein [Pirellulaceae bacterium]